MGGSNSRNERRALTAARLVGALAGLALCSAVACSEGTDVIYQVNGNAAEPVGPGAPGDGVLTGSPVPPADVLGGEGAAPVPQASGAGTTSPVPQESPPPVQAPPAGDPSAAGGEPQPQATETNFFGAGCRSDVDCGENRRCEFPVDAEAGAAPAPDGEASPDAGADAAVPETLVPRGHCIAR